MHLTKESPAEGVVYLIQEPLKHNFDLSSAERYGKIISLLDSMDSPSHCPGPCMKKIREKLINYRPERDNIAWAGGDLAGIFYTGLILRDLGFGEVQFLKWNRERGPDGQRTGGGSYQPVKLVVKRRSEPVAAKDHEIFD